MVVIPSLECVATTTGFACIVGHIVCIVGMQCWCILSHRAVNFKYIAIEWMKPRTFGDAAVAAYKVYVNGVVEATLSADQLSFSFSKGVACQEYVFQVQVSPST